MRRTLDMRAGPVVSITVWDTGSGMDEATRASAFDPFFTTKPLAQGLGLPTVYGIVRQTNGAVTLESTPGAGTKVEIVLPDTWTSGGGAAVARSRSLRSRPSAPGLPSCSWSRTKRRCCGWSGGYSKPMA